MFGLKFQGIYLPWVLVAFTVLMGGDPKPDLAGIAAAHLFYFLKDVYPENNGGKKLIGTPQFVRGLFSNEVRDPNTNAFGVIAGTVAGSDSDRKPPTDAAWRVTG
jgi:hypothetical protein